MELETLHCDLTICKVPSIAALDLTGDFYFIGRTDAEISLVCPTENTPPDTIAREDGWKGFRIRGTLDFSLIGILSCISGVLADHKIGVFAVSTYDTDYILVKTETFDGAAAALQAAGYTLR